MSCNTPKEFTQTSYYHYSHHVSPACPLSTQTDPVTITYISRFTDCQFLCRLTLSVFMSTPAILSAMITKTIKPCTIFLLGANMILLENTVYLKGCISKFSRDMAYLAPLPEPHPQCSPKQFHLFPPFILTRTIKSYSVHNSIHIFPTIYTNTEGRSLTFP